MRTHIIEATNGPQNWGKFLIGIFDTEWSRRSAIVPDDHIEWVKLPLLTQIGISPKGSIFVLDLQTCEGAIFRHGGSAKADLDKHKVWVCPLFQPFLTWLYTQPLEKVLLLDLPDLIDLPDAPFALHGYRRTGGHP